MTEKVSVIIPIYNGESRLSACIQSVREQTYQDLEILLIDDGSADHSLDICRAAEAEDDRIRVFHHKNHGVSYTRNVGIDNAKGDFLVFVDCDDLTEPNMTERLYRVQKETDADVVIGAVRVIDDAGNESVSSPNPGTYTAKEIFSCLSQESDPLYGYLHNKLFRTGLIKTAGIVFDPAYRSQEDLDFNLRAFACAERITCTDVCGYSYYYTKSTRPVDYSPVFHNLLFLLDRTKALSLDPSPIAGRILHMFYIAVFHAQSVGDIRTLTEQSDLQNVRKIKNTQSKKVKVVASLAAGSHYRMLYDYFRLRSFAKKMLRMKTE